MDFTKKHVARCKGLACAVCLWSHFHGAVFFDRDAIEKQQISDFWGSASIV